VPKILVADDNSNIQKMVGLALKDQGIDVVAVGNGEAAVRKISDLRPDLVLADVFMPVRNGYEVCQYVKADPSLAHIPVILLVGAFDPLDEQEAQRVGADGVLKKPFVPPDPLISMVKSALQRAGVAHGNAVKVPEREPLKASDLLAPSSPALQTASQVPSIAPLAQESFVDDVPARPGPEPVRIDSHSQPVAFGSLLETPTDEKDEDLELQLPTNQELMPERDWRDPDAAETEEEEEEEKPAASWRREDDESYAKAGSKGASKGGAKDWRAGSFEQIQAKKIPVDSWEPIEEKPQLVEAAPPASNLVTEAPPAPASIPKATPVTPVTATIATSPLASDAWAPPSSPAPQQKISAETATVVEEVAREKDHVPPASEAVVSKAPESTPAKPETKTSKESWFSVPSNPWNAEIEKANKLASAWDAAVPVAAPPVSSNGAEKTAEPVSEETQRVIEEAALPEAAVEAIREEAAQVAEDAAQATEQLDSDRTTFYATVEPLVETAAPVPAATATPSMDDLVARVLAKMSPEVLQAVTREILKPVVEAMVKEEMKSKKS
jgi:CheY-like chemotaxis protein